MPEGTTPHACQFKEVYYGYECTICKLFVPFGCEPWAPTDENDESNDWPDCRFCGGENGPGYSSCTCEFEDSDDEEQELESGEGNVW